MCYVRQSIGVSSGIVVCAIMMTSVCGCRQESHFDIARDANRSETERTRATLQLTESDRRRLQTELISKLPGEWNTSATADAIYLLGEIGDDDAIEKLEQMKNTDARKSGKINALIDDALDRLHRRMREKSSAPYDK